MASNSGSRSAVPGKNESLIIGILVGMVLGLAVAGGVAWYLVKRPSPYLKTEPTNTDKSEPAPLKPAPSTDQAEPPTPQAGTTDSKPRFEFYKILTDKQDNSPTDNTGTSQTPNTSQITIQPTPQSGPLFLQAASFTTAEDADKLKARLALLGLEANVQSANVPSKGMRYRVRLGPYRNIDELDRANIVLKQNGIMDATTIHAQ